LDKAATISQVRSRWTSGLTRERQIHHHQPTSAPLTDALYFLVDHLIFFAHGSIGRRIWTAFSNHSVDAAAGRAAGAVRSAGAGAGCGTG
jgi:hypothetical protein